MKRFELPIPAIIKFHSNNSKWFNQITQFKFTYLNPRLALANQHMKLRVLLLNLQPGQVASRRRVGLGIIVLIKRLVIVIAKATPIALVNAMAIRAACTRIISVWHCIRANQILFVVEHGRTIVIKIRVLVGRKR
jgi:hypothetical protein